MTRILIDCTHIDFQRQPTGIPRVVLKYIEEGYLWAEATGNEIIPVVPTPSGFLLCRPVPGRNPPRHLVELEKQSLTRTRAGKDGLAEETPPLIVLREGDIVFAPSYWHDNDPEYYIDAKRRGAHVVILVHDILPISHKVFYASPWRYQFSAAVLQAIGYADLLLCVSDTTRIALELFAAGRGRTMPQVAVAHNGFEHFVAGVTAQRMREGGTTAHTRDAQALKALAGEAFLLMVGSVEPKKGHIPVIKCLEAMWAAGYRRNLVIIGRIGWMEREIVDYIDSSPYRNSRLFWLSEIDDHDLAYFYLKSRALLFASVAEGFGIPMIEAAMLGKPVIVLDTAIAREVLADYGRYFTTASDLVGQLLQLEDSAAYRTLSDSMKGFDWPTWEDCVPRVFEDVLLRFQPTEAASRSL